MVSRKREKIGVMGKSENYYTATNGKPTYTYVQYNEKEIVIIQTVHTF